MDRKWRRVRRFQAAPAAAALAAIQDLFHNVTLFRAGRPLD
jgi:hypothetical protein